VKWLLSAIVLGIGLTQAGPKFAQSPPVRDIPLEERLWLAQIANGSFDPFPEESAQLLKACGDPRLVFGRTAATYYACVTKYMKAARYLIAKLYAAPTESSPVVASVFEERKVTAENQFEFTWTVELTSHAGDRLPWPDAAAVFDYGLHLAGVQRRGDWVRLLTSIPADGWLRITPTPNIPDGLPLYVYVEPLNGQIVNLSPLTARWPDGRRELTEQGTYLILNITRAVVEFRAEIPSDFACGETVTDPVPVPPTLRAPTSEFFNRDGTPRFSEAYTKGC
jgi:hypothetical protein